MVQVLTTPGVPAKIIFESRLHHLEDCASTSTGPEEEPNQPVLPRHVTTSLCLGGYPESRQPWESSTAASSTDGQNTPECDCDERAKTGWACDGVLATGTCGDGRTTLRSKAVAFVPVKRAADGGGEPDPGVLELWIERGGISTLMLHNIPKSYSRAMLIDMLNDLGFSRDYDFVYLPAKLETGMNFGYAFVNLSSVDAAKRLNREFHAHCAVVPFSDRFCPVTPSKIQGLAANICRYQSSPIMNGRVPDHFKPAVFVRGKCVPFPLPAGGPGGRPRTLKKMEAKVR